MPHFTSSSLVKKALGAAIIGAAAIVPAVSVQAKPAYPGLITASQPDGSEVTFRIVGDENAHRILSPEGEELAFDAEGFLRPASEAAPLTRSEERPSRKYLFSGAAFPSFDSPKALVVLVYFPDKFFSMENPKEYFTRLLNEEGFSDDGATGSARDFFVSNSLGRFTPQFDVYGPVRTGMPMKYYGANDRWGMDMHPEEMVIEALMSLDSTVDFTQYDTDGDGVIDNVYIFYAGFGEADSNVVNSIWPHSADILDFNLEKDYYFDGVLLNRYAMSNELTFKSNKPDGIGTFVHEFSHVLGLPDLYSTTYSGAFTPDRYDTLDYAPYNNQGRTPANYSVFERYCMGWLEPRNIYATGDYSLAPLHESNDGFIIRTERPDEFFMIENRQKVGYDEFIPGHGMLVWHIDFNQDVWDDNSVNNSRAHQYIDLVEADNRLTEISRAGDTFPGTAGVTSFTGSTKPALRSWNDRSLYVKGITDIREDDNGVISFHADVDMSGVDDIPASSADAVTISGNRITNNGVGELPVHSVSGMKVAVIPPGRSAALPAGLYIAAGRRIMIRK